MKATISRNVKKEINGLSLVAENKEDAELLTILCKKAPMFSSGSKLKVRAIGGGVTEPHGSIILGWEE